MGPESGERTRQLYDELAAALAPAGVVKGSMFGKPCLKVGRKMLAGLWGDAMNFKLPPDARAEALALAGAEPFDPAGGRPTKEWVVVPLAESASWPKLAERALEFVRE